MTEHSPAGEVPRSEPELGGRAEQTAPAAPFGTILPPPPARRRRGPASPVTRWVTSIVAGATSVGLAGYVFLVDPNKPGGYPICPLKALTGVDCPGCGGLRSTHAMLHGDIGAAIDHNVLALVMVPTMAYFLLKWVVALWGKDLPDLRLPRWAGWAFPVAILVFSVLRNIPNTPFWYLNSATY